MTRFFEPPCAAAGTIELRSGLTAGALCTRLHKLGVLAPAAQPNEPREQNRIFSSPQSLSAALVNNRNFRRDTPIGGILHGKAVSIRELSPTDSLHVVIDGDRVSAHVDLVSPLNFDPQRPAQYAPARVLAHNLTGMAENLLRLARAQVGPRRRQVVVAGPA